MKKELAKEWKRLTLFFLSVCIMWTSGQFIGIETYDNAGKAQVNILGFILGIVIFFIGGTILIYGLGFKENQKTKIERYMLNLFRGTIYGITILVIYIIISYLCGVMSAGIYNIFSNNLTYTNIQNIVYILIKMIWILLISIIYNTLWLIPKQEIKIEKRKFLKSYILILSINIIKILLEFFITLISISVLKNILLAIIYIFTAVISIMIAIKVNKGEFKNG